MLLSLFTPTHDATWLPAVYDSILRQTYTNWQWVILPNGKAVIPQRILADPRVKIVPAAATRNIGSLKRLGCENCDGSAFIEMDHDDLLVPGNTLAIIAKLIAGGAGFVYSDVAAFRSHNFEPHTYGEDHGWESYPFKVYGHKLQASRNFPLTPRALCEVYYSPDHVRCWGRKAYYDAGGHDKTLEIGDDHDLMCRTYLSGHPWVATGGCHYLYRMHNKNTVWETQDKIEKQVIKNKLKYLQPLIREWCRREQHEILNIQQLLNDGWRWERDLYHGFPDTGYGAIIADDVLQYCPKRLVTEFFNKCYEALLPGGYLEARVPSTKGEAAFMDHRAESYWCLASFLPYSHGNLVHNPDLRCRFQYVQGYNNEPDPFHKEFHLTYSTVVMSALKGQRQPGLKHI